MEKEINFIVIKSISQNKHFSSPNKLIKVKKAAISATSSSPIISQCAATTEALARTGM